MTSLLIPGAVALLAHKRLRDTVDALERKIGGDVYDAFFVGTDTVVVGDTERRVLGLAKAAAEMFEAGPPIDAGDSLQVGHGFGRFAIAGSAAFELPAYTGLYLPLGGWVADAVRRGTPDANLSRVVVGSSQLAVRTGELAIGLASDDAAQARIQSFTMGMLSALASAVVVSPVLRGLQAARTKRDWNPGEPAVDVAAVERRIVGNLLGGSTGAAAWPGWWPKRSDLPDALLDGYVQALEEAYALSAHRPHGFGDFEERFGVAAPPGQTRDRLRDGYSLARLDTQLAAWGAGTWYLALLPLLIAPVAGFALVLALPHGKAFLDPALHVDERSAWEVLTLGTGLGALAPAGYSIVLWTQLPENTEAFAEAVAMFAARAALALGSIGADNTGAGVRWGLLFTPLALFDVYGLVRGLIEKSRGHPAGFVFLLQTTPVLTGGAVLLSAALGYGMTRAGVDKGVTYGVVLGTLAAGVLAGVGIPLAVALSHSGGLRSLLGLTPLAVGDSLAALAEAQALAAPAALFDDSTLWFDPAIRTPGPALSDLRYPSGRRALLRIWWTGEGALEIAHDEHTVTFKKADGSSKDIALPPGKTSAADLAALLMAQLPGIHAEPYDPADPLYDLPYPHTLDDLGDTQATIALHDAHAHDFAPVGTTHDEAYVLRHTPRAELITSYGPTGPASSQLDAFGVVPGQMLGDLESSAMGLAADLAALLCMGAAPSLAGTAPGSTGSKPAEVRGPVVPSNPAGRAPLGNLGPVFEVFRQWNLDERRVNEWRQLIQGGGERDQPDPAHADPGMRPAPAGYANQAQSAAPPPPSPAPELMARSMGWVPLWRAWSRMAADVTSDTSASTAMHYTPAVALPDGTQFRPANADLTNAIRFLLDLP